jgi:hypothetical protein
LELKRKVGPILLLPESLDGLACVATASPDYSQR